MAQLLAVEEFATAVATYVVPANDAQNVVVATSEGKIQQLTFHTSQDITLNTLAHLDEGMLYAVAAYPLHDGVPALIAATSEGNIYHLTAQQQQKIGSFADTIIAAVAGYAVPGNDTQQALVATADGTVYLLSFQSGQEAVSQQELTRFESGVINVVGYVTPADGNEHIFITASDGKLHHITRTPQQQVAQSVLAFFEESYISMTSYITPSDGLLHIIPATRDGKLYHVIYDPHQTQQTYVDIRDGVPFHDASLTPGITADILIRFYLLTPSPMMFISGYVTPADGIQHVAVVTTDGALHLVSFQGRPQSAEEVKHEVIAQFNSMV